MLRITCHSLTENQDFTLDLVKDYILKENFLMLGFEITSSPMNLVTYFTSGTYLFNIVHADRIESFVGEFCKCTLINDKLYLIFYKKEM